MDNKSIQQIEKKDVIKVNLSPPGPGNGLKNNPMPGGNLVQGDLTVS